MATDERRVDVDIAQRVLAMFGEFDLDAAADLRACFQLFGAGPALVVDMAEVTFIGSTVMGILVEAMRRGITISIRNPSRIAARVLDVSGFLDLVSVGTGD